MRKLLRVLFGFALITAAAVSAPPEAASFGYCDHCARYMDCYSCCMCDENGSSYCLDFCFGS